MPRTKDFHGNTLFQKTDFTFSGATFEVGLSRQPPLGRAFLGAAFEAELFSYHRYSGPFQARVFRQPFQAGFKSFIGGYFRQSSRPFGQLFQA